jgi:hypothetical protein
MTAPANSAGAPDAACLSPTVAKHAKAAKANQHGG